MNLDQSQQLLYGRYIFIKKIGTGSFGQVSLVQQNQKQFVIKKVESKQYNGKQTSILRKFDHPNIVKLLGEDVRFNYTLILTEYCNLGDMLKYQKTLDKQVYSLQQGIEAFFQIASGLQCVHKEKTSHRDIKPANIFLHQEGQKITYKLGDFGSSSLDSIHQSKIGTEYFEAPEMLSYDEEDLEGYDKQIDIWSLGVTFYYMLNGKFPFAMKSPEERLNQALQKCIPYYKYTAQNSNPDIDNLFQRMFEIKPNKRITIDELVKLPIFAKLSGDSEIKHTSNIQNRENEQSPQEVLQNETAQELFKVTQQKLINQRQIDNILMFLITDIQTSKRYFNQMHHMALIYNTLKLYVINHNKIRKYLEQLQSKPNYKQFCSNPWYRNFTKTIDQQLTSAYKKLLNQYKICKNNKENINKSFKNNQFKVIIQQKITQTEFDGEFKDFYRLTTSTCYENMIGVTDPTEALLLKFKIFICHGFNRIFQHHRQVLNKYYEWIKPNVELTSNLFEKWVNNQSKENIDETLKKIKRLWFKE